jgi:aerobic carbon-monoxide dehydrogenase medium subunit
MIPEAFEYTAPATIAEAMDLLASRGDDVKVLAGGHSLIPMMKLRLASPGVLVDIGRIPELRGIHRHSDRVTIGATTTHAQIEQSGDLRDRFPIMAETATVIGDPLVRHRGTFGGSLAHADPAGDWPAVALALDATIRATGPNGERAIPAREFFIDLFTSALEPDELLTAVDLPYPTLSTGMAYEKFAHPASGYAVIGIAAVIGVDADGICRDCRVGITGAGAKATRADAAEMMLLGELLTGERIQQASRHAAAEIELLSDLVASERYRAHLVTVLTDRALRTAWERARPLAAKNDWYAN